MERCHSGGNRRIWPMSRIYVLHENPAWIDPFAEAFARRGLPWSEWPIDRGVVDLGRTPPEGVFYSRISASSHTRDHRFAPDCTAALLAWLERHGRRVVNGLAALDLEVSKVRQYAALEAAGIRVPRTVAVVGRDHVVEAEPRPKFRISDGIDAKLRSAYEGFLARNGIEIAGIEFIRGLDGEIRTYD